MENKRILQATSPLAAWLSYLENLHSKTIDLGLERVSQVAARLDVLRPAPFVFTGMLDNKVINMSQSKKTALAANLTQDQIRQAVDRADKWIQAQ